MRTLLKTTFIGLSFITISCVSKKDTKFSESKFLTDSVYSKYLSEYRKHNIYLIKIRNTLLFMQQMEIMMKKTC